MSEAEGTRYYDAKVARVDSDANQVVIETLEGKAFRMTRTNAFTRGGDRGVLTVFNDGRAMFSPYPEQLIFRWPERDLLNRDNTVFAWAWRLHGSDDCIRCKPGVVPGKYGVVIPDETQTMELDVPPEFLELCEDRGLTAETVLRGFIADLCGLENYMNNPREDGYSSNGSDERRMAQEWFDRAHPEFD